MRKISMFNQVSVDGFFKAPDGDVGWTHEQGPDAEFDDWVGGNASRRGRAAVRTHDLRDDGELLADADRRPQQMPIVAKDMNGLPKCVFAHARERAVAERASFEGRSRRRSEEAEERERKDGRGQAHHDLGSGSVVAQLARPASSTSTSSWSSPDRLGGGRSRVRRDGQ